MSNRICVCECVCEYVCVCNDANDILCNKVWREFLDRKKDEPSWAFKK